MIEIVDVHKSFGTQKVLDGVNLSIGRGETTVIIGRSGGGKSTLLRLLIGLTRPDRGKILVEGEDITRMKGKTLARIRKKFGMLFQYAALFDSMSVFDNVAFPLVEHTRMSRGEI
ncbi:MAG: ATP-binding cassette domain-containing protein, partial [Deltaproteobacteria bacterium]